MSSCHIFWDLRKRIDPNTYKSKINQTNKKPTTNQTNRKTKQKPNMKIEGKENDYNKQAIGLSLACYDLGEKL